jgi:hypothetical protein
MITKFAVIKSRFLTQDIRTFLKKMEETLQ